MIPKETSREVIKSGEFVEQSMGIDKASMSYILTILRQNIYSDPIKSLIREYTTNAIDEHVKLSKTDVPVILQLPNTFSPELRVRDFGIGLTDEQVFHFFGKYGASDKRESNELIGAFGIGCKSAFAYTDSFNVISFKNGRKATFNIFIGEDNIGTVARMTEQTTDEENGLEIVVPVKKDDISTFVSRGYELVKYLKTKPTLKGVNNPPSFERAKAALSGDFWRYFGDSRETIIIQGQIGYPIDTGKVGQTHYGSGEAPKGYINEWEYALLNSGLQLEVKIGEVEVTASREQLQMSDATIAAIRKRLSEVKAEIQDYAEKRLKSAKTMIEAKTAYYELFLKGGSFGNQLHEAIGEVKWKGVIIKDNVIRLSDSHKVMQYAQKRNGNITLTVFDKIQCSDTLNLYYDDTDRRAFMYRRRAKTLLDSGSVQVTVIQTDDIAGLKKDTGLVVADLSQYSTITPTILNTTRGGGSGVDASKRAKHQVNVFELDVDKLLKGYVKGSNSDYWKVATIVPSKQVYIPIDRFIPQSIGIDTLKELRQYLVELKTIGAEITVPIYGLKPKQSAGNMVRFDAFFKQHVTAIPNLGDDATLIADFTSSLTNLRIALENLPDDSVAKAYKTLWSEAYELCEKEIPSHYSYGSSASKAKIKMKLAKFAGLDSTRKGELTKLAKEFDEMYPLIRKCAGNSYGSIDVPLTTALTEYIQLIFDSKEK